MNKTTSVDLYLDCVNINYPVKNQVLFFGSPFFLPLRTIRFPKVEPCSIPWKLWGEISRCTHSGGKGSGWMWHLGSLFPLEEWEAEGRLITWFCVAQEKGNVLICICSSYPSHVVLVSQVQGGTSDLLLCSTILWVVPCPWIVVTSDFTFSHK